MGEERLLGWELTHALGADPTFTEKFVATLRNSGDEEAMYYEPVNPEIATPQEFELRKTGNHKRFKAILLVGGGPKPKYRRKKTDVFRKGGGLNAFFAGTGSQNIPKLRYETRRRHGFADGEDFWREAFEHEKNVFMGSEDGSRIYGDWHLLATASAMDAASPEVAGEALEWVAYYLAICKLFEVDGEIFWPGQRSAGHPTKPGLREWIYARAMDGDVRRAEGWCKESGVGLASRWEKFATEKLQANLDKAAARARELTRADLEARGRMAPIRLLKSQAGGLAVWIERGNSGFSCVNPNTPPVVAAIRYTDRDSRFFPANGGKRVRQQFDRCFVERNGDTLRYESEIYLGDEADLPPGPYELDMTIGRVA
jgi:hypothetical protein